jgi:hypothetical protein
LKEHQPSSQDAQLCISAQTATTIRPFMDRIISRRKVQAKDEIPAEKKRMRASVE